MRELMPAGLLWAINRTVFHPRGFALALHVDEAGEIAGWSLLGDGTERWAFDYDEEGQDFLNFEKTLNDLRPTT